MNKTIESVREEIKRRESEGETENWDLGLCCLKSKVEGYELAQKEVEKYQKELLQEIEYLENMIKDERRKYNKEFLDKLEKYKCGKHKKLKNILKKSLSEEKSK